MFNSLFNASDLAGAASFLPGTKAAGALAAASRSTGGAAYSAGGDVHDTVYYAKCMVAGAASCGITHTAIVPLDIVKCRMQTNPELYPGILAGFRALGQQGGYTLGWLPTFLGYSAQGFCKFGFYEVFKDLYAGFFSPEKAYEYRTMIYLAASASAEVIADVALCPMEAVKVRMQTSPPEAKFPTTLGAAVSKIKDAEGMNGFFKGLGPLWGRQVPYTVTKFVFYERVVEAFYKYIFTAPKESYGSGTQLIVTFASGYVAGILCAVVSHPADTIVSKLNQNPTGGIGAIVNEMGMWNLATKGLGARVVMIGTLTGLQWLVYNSAKLALGLSTAGGVKK
jgi:solute carrier family 25 phosphate transporter 3